MTSLSNERDERYTREMEEEGWAIINSCEGRCPNLKRKVIIHEDAGPTNKWSTSMIKNSTAVSTDTTSPQDSGAPPLYSNDKADEILFQTFHTGKIGMTGPAGFDSLMQSQYFAVADDGAKLSNETPVALLSIHPMHTGTGVPDALEELFSDDGCGYIDDDFSEPCSPRSSLTPSIVDELETSVGKADSKKIACAFASIVRKCNEEGQPTIISMRLVPKCKERGGSDGLAVSCQDENEKKPSEVYNRFSVVGPIDLADPNEIARHLQSDSSRAYLVTECHPSPDHEAFKAMDKDAQSHLLWDWSVFREDSSYPMSANTDKDYDDDDDDAKTVEDEGENGSGLDTKESVLTDLLQNSILFPMTKKIFYESILPALVTTHVVSVLVGVVIGRRLCAPHNRR